MKQQHRNIMEFCSNISAFKVTARLVLLGICLLSGLIVDAQDDPLFIDSKGNIGIGTTSPSVRLDIRKGVIAMNDSSIRFRSGGDRNYMIGYNSTLDGIVIKGFEGVMVGAQTDTLAIFKRGNVFIGTAKKPVTFVVKGRIKDQTGFVMPVGSILAYADTIAPEGWIVCNGQSIANNPKFADLLKVLGQDKVPNLGSKFIVGTGRGELNNRPLTKYERRATGGEETHTLSVEEMPSHNHSYHKAKWPYGHRDGGEDWARYGRQEQDNGDNTGDTGGNKPHENRPPYYALTYIIKY